MLLRGAYVFGDPFRDHDDDGLQFVSEGEASLIIHLVILRAQIGSGKEHHQRGGANGRLLCPHMLRNYTKTQAGEATLKRVCTGGLGIYRSRS